jgi:stearoyl-CoA desaturase (Delta-9 desaturase)
VAAVFYLLTLTGITVGYHRHFTHRSFKTGRSVRIMLAVLGGMALQGPIITWVADHRRHHAFADKEGDPHSPWLFGKTPGAVAEGFWLVVRERPAVKNSQRISAEFRSRGETDDAR